MNFIETDIKGLVVIEPTIIKDDRGYFFEAFNKKIFQKHGVNADFVQDNQSLSKKDVLRGLHFQKPPYGQAKLVSVAHGAVLDIAVDIRKDSATYGEYCAVELSSQNKKMFYIPEGFAHGFLALEDDTIFSYKCSNFYNKESEDALLWNDGDLSIEWGIKAPILSSKDLEAKPFSSFESPF